MENYEIYKNLKGLNELPEAKAKAAFRACCGSDEWARLMTGSRPFRMVEDLFTAASRHWFNLSSVEWLEAFAAHPQIGSDGGSPRQNATASAWSEQEQSGAAQAPADVKTELGRLNRLYAEKFGFIFIVCATGKTAEEMLAICHARIGNSVETELRIAVEEQRKITEIRLNKLLEQ